MWLGEQFIEHGGVDEDRGLLLLPLLIDPPKIEQLCLQPSLDPGGRPPAQALGPPPDQQDHDLQSPHLLILDSHNLGSPQPAGLLVLQRQVVPGLEVQQVAEEEGLEQRVLEQQACVGQQLVDRQFGA
jgi:hypothetical protein